MSEKSPPVLERDSFEGLKETNQHDAEYWSARDPQQAICIHGQVGRKSRGAIKRIGGDLPESIPPAEHIKEVEERIKIATPRLELDERDAGGLLGDVSDKNIDE